MATDLRTLQQAAVMQMLNLNQNQNEKIMEMVWKVLVYDKRGQEIIAPLLRLNNLRELSITLHMLIDAPQLQEQQPDDSALDAVAIYFIEPRRESIDQLINDLRLKKFQEFHVNFTHGVSRELLEHLAQQSIEASNAFRLIKGVYDQYLNYSTLERNMFSLNLQQSYQVLNSPRSVDTQIEQLVQDTATALYSVFCTQGAVPVIKAARGGAAEMVAKRLESKLRDVRQVSGGMQLLEQKRPLLIVLDRNMDLATMMHHTWSYQCLVHDVMDMRANRVIYEAEEQGRTVKKVYDFDLDDYFWARNAALPFPQMAEDVDSELAKYKKETDDLTRACGVDSLDQINPVAGGSVGLKLAIQALPALTARKRTIDMHMNIASHLLKSVKQRGLDDYIVKEEAGAKLTCKQLVDLFSGDKGTPEDKLRLFLVYYLSPQYDLSSADLKEALSVLEGQKCDMQVYEYVKSVKAFSKLAIQSDARVQQKQSMSSTDSGTFMNRLSSVRDSAFGTALDTLISGVKNVITTSTRLPVTREVERLADGPGAFGGSGSPLLGGPSGGASDDQDYVTMDPRQSRTGRRGQAQGGSPQSQRTQISSDDVYVFVCGGGNYVEYQSLQEYAKQAGKRVTYGSTEIVNATHFMHQLAACALVKQ